MNLNEALIELRLVKNFQTRNLKIKAHVWKVQMRDIYLEIANNIFSHDLEWEQRLKLLGVGAFQRWNLQVFPIWPGLEESRVIATL